MLPECAADPVFKYAKGLSYMDDALTAAGRAQKFSRTAAVKIILCSVKPYTARLRRWFSVSSRFSGFN